MWQHWQHIIKEEAEKYGYGQKTEIEEAKAPRFPKGFKQGETLWVPPGNDRGELVSWKAGKNPGGIFTVKLFKTGKTVEVSAVDIYKANSPKLLSTKEEVEEAYAPLDTKGIVGAFTEATKKKRFEYRNSTDSWGKSHGLPHEVCVSSPGGGLTQWRSANVKGTVCYIAVDEGADGKPVMEKWAIRNHVKYVKAESVEVEVDEAFNPADHGFRIDKEEVEQIEEAKMLTGPGKKDPKRLVGIYTMRGKWIKDMNSEAEAKAFVNKSWGESVEVNEENLNIGTYGFRIDRDGGKFVLYQLSYNRGSVRFPDGRTGTVIGRYATRDEAIAAAKRNAGVKEETEQIDEAKFNTNDLLDSIESAYKKGGLKGVIQGGKQFGLTDRTTVDELLDSAKSMFGADLKKAATEIKGFLKPQDYAKYKSKMESVEKSNNWKQIYETLAKAGGRRDVFLDAIEKAYKKGGLKGIIEGGKSFGFYDRTDVHTALDNFDELFDKKDREYAATEIKGFLKPQDYAKYKSKIEADIEDGEDSEDKPKEYAKIKVPGKDEFEKIAKGVATKKLKRQATIQAVNKTGLKVIQTIGKQTLLRIALKVLGKEGARMLLSKIPVVGLALGTVFAVNRLAKGEYIKAAIELVGGVASTLPGYGTAAALACDAALVTGDISKIKKMQDDLMKVRSGEMSEDDYKKKYRMDKLALESKSDPRFEQFDNAVKMLTESDIDSSIEVDDEIIDMLFEEIDSSSWESIHEAKADEAANLANEIRKVAKNNGVSITVESNTSVSFSKDFTKGNMDEFFAAYRDCDQVRRMVKFKSRGNEWGCGSSGFGIGAQECVKSGKVRLSKSGDGASYLLKALSKRF